MAAFKKSKNNIINVFDYIKIKLFIYFFKFYYLKFYNLKRRKMSNGKILSIQSHVVHGYVGNRAAVFPLQVSRQTLKKENI